MCVVETAKPSNIPELSNFSSLPLSLLWLLTLLLFSSLVLLLFVITFYSLYLL